MSKNKNYPADFVERYLGVKLPKWQKKVLLASRIELAKGRQRNK
jgi:hypothetical protein